MPINLLEQVYLATHPGANLNRQPAAKVEDTEAAAGLMATLEAERTEVGRMIEKRPLIMTVRENVHQIVDTLPDEQLDDVLDYPAGLSEPDEPPSAETRAAIEEGLNDIRHGCTIPAGRVPPDARSVKYEIRLSHRRSGISTGWMNLHRSALCEGWSSWRKIRTIRACRAIERCGKSAEVARGCVADYLPGGRGGEDRQCWDDRAPRAGLQTHLSTVLKRLETPTG
ncbi:MAG: hypothetical protein ABSG41_15755 [Bryobacteraceae bacterium]